MSHNYINTQQKIFDSQTSVSYTMLNSNYKDKMYSSSFNYTSTNGSLATSGISSQFDSAETVNQSLLRRDNEIERLKMRILLLEQQQLPSNDAVPINLNHNGELKLREIELNTAMLRMEMKTNASKDAHIAKLESLLNQREYEIQEMGKKYNTKLSEMDKELNKFKTLLSSKDEEFLVEKNKMANFQKENEKLRSKLTDRDNYISKLPTEEEVKETDRKMAGIQYENEELKVKINDLEKRNIRAKQLIKEKQAEVKSALDKVEKADLEKEKVRLEFEQYKKLTQEVGELIERCEQNASLHAELEVAKKMILSLQDRLKAINQKHEEETHEFKEKARLELDVATSLRNELDDKERLVKSLENSIREIAEKNQNYFTENLTLNEKIKSMETLMNKDSLKLLQNLFKELNVCTSDLDGLVGVCVDLYNGKNVDICNLLGVSDRNRTDYIELADGNIINNLINSDYLIKKTADLKKLKAKLGEIRKIVSDEYAEKIGSNISCITQ